jgi:hypothetical protein
MRPDALRVSQRNFRLREDSKVYQAEAKEKGTLLRLTKSPEYSTLMGHVGRTFLDRQRIDAAENPMVVEDVFAINTRKRYAPWIPKVGQWDPYDPHVQGHWCYDTPGVINENQVCPTPFTDFNKARLFKLGR